MQTISVVTNEEGQPSHYVGAMMDISAQKQAEKTLIDAREHLENQVAISQEEVEKNKKEIIEINTALNVLLKNREKDKDEAQISLSNQVEGLVMPLLKKLKDSSKGRHQALHMIGVIEDNVKVLMKYYGRANNLDSDYQKLTMTERQVASMVKLGKPTKVIASTLNISPGTVSIHRKNIRKKLLLNNEINLQAYLQSLIE